MKDLVNGFKRVVRKGLFNVLTDNVLTCHVTGCEILAREGKIRIYCVEIPAA